MLLTYVGYASLVALAQHDEQEERRKMLIRGFCCCSSGSSSSSSSSKLCSLAVYINRVAVADFRREGGLGGHGGMGEEEEALERTASRLHAAGLDPLGGRRRSRRRRS